MCRRGPQEPGLLGSRHRLGGSESREHATRRASEGREVKGGQDLREATRRRETSSIEVLLAAGRCGDGVLLPTGSNLEQWETRLEKTTHDETFPGNRPDEDMHDDRPGSDVGKGESG